MSIHFDDAHQMAKTYAKAWCSLVPDNVANHFAPQGQIIINNGDPMIGRPAISDMAAAFYAEFPDLQVFLDDFRFSGNHALFAWTLEGTHSETGNMCRVPGWEEWNLNDDLQVVQSPGWFNATEYDRQVAHGI